MKKVNDLIRDLLRNIFKVSCNKLQKRSDIISAQLKMLNLENMFSEILLNPKAPLAAQESYNPTPRSVERKESSSPYGSNYPVWLRHQADITVENKHMITNTMLPFVIAGRCLGLVPTRYTLLSYSALFIFFSVVTVACVRTVMSFSNVKRFDGTFMVVFLMFVHYVKCLFSLYYLRRLLGPASSDFYGLWEDVVEGAHRCPESKKHITKWVTCGVWYTVFGTVISASCVTLGSIQNGFELPGLDSIILYPDFIWLNGIFMFASSCFDFMLQAIYTVLCMAIYFEFKNLLRKLSITILPTMPDVEYYLKFSRLHHFQLTDLTDQLDSLVSYHAFIILAGNLPILCALLFVIGNAKQSFGTTLTLSCWVVKLLAEILIVSLPPSAISYIAVQPLYPVHEISNKLSLDIDKLTDIEEFVDDYDNKELISEELVEDHDWMTKQVNPLYHTVCIAYEFDQKIVFKVYQETFLFVQQLTKRQIGITCGGFFTITKETLLTVISVMITYFALILQLDLSAQFHCECDCNETLLN